MSLRLDLNLDLDIELKAKIHGDGDITFEFDVSHFLSSFLFALRHAKWALLPYSL
jgi:hypothetical protein